MMLVLRRAADDGGRGGTLDRHAQGERDGGGRRSETLPKCSRRTSCPRAAAPSDPKTLNQKRYVDAIDKHAIVFGIGPAGTGKTYLAMAKAVQALQSKQVNRIILAPRWRRASGSASFPGTLYEKIDPYLRPLYDALREHADPSPSRGSWRRGPSRSRRSPTCAVAP